MSRNQCQHVRTAGARGDWHLRLRWKEPEEDRQAHLNYPKLAGQLLLTFRCLSGVSSPLRPARAFASGICPQWLRRLSLSHCWDRHSQMDRLPVELGSLVLVDHQGWFSQNHLPMRLNPWCSLWRWCYMAPDTKPCRSALVCSCHVPSCYLHDPDGNFTKDHGFRSFWPLHPAKVLWVAAWCAPRFSAGQRLPQNHSHLSPQQVSDKESLRSGRRVGGARPRPNTEVGRTCFGWESQSQCSCCKVFLVTHARHMSFESASCAFWGRCGNATHSSLIACLPAFFSGVPLVHGEQAVGPAQ